MATVRRVLITGGGRGIGRAVALRLAQDGHSIAVTARSENEIGAVAAEVGGVALAVDLADAEAASALAGRAAEVLGGPVEIFVHAAGIASIAPLHKLSPEDWRRAFAVNVDAAFYVGRDLMRPMRDAGWGRIVTIASLRARVGVPTTGAYAASKHALLGLTRVIAAELAPHGATANAVVPGWVDTQMVQDEITKFAAALDVSREEAQRRLLREQKIGRFLAPAEVAGMVGYLCGEEAAGVTGQALHIDGGSYQA
ncbi:MAG: 3-oxoacyl-[acyl-carrier protein] reductase [Solirubrobacteraceae bacterium]|nr:3-oxoacyl-[acyl-carrier protein] reductase [Solirubrobacteraceae bacterium]